MQRDFNWLKDPFIYVRNELILTVDKKGTPIQPLVPVYVDPRGVPYFAMPVPAYLVLQPDLYLTWSRPDGLGQMLRGDAHHELQTKWDKLTYEYMVYLRQQTKPPKRVLIRRKHA